MGAPHKETRSLTKRLQKTAVSGREPARLSHQLPAPGEDPSGIVALLPKLPASASRAPLRAPLAPGDSVLPKLPKLQGTVFSQTPTPVARSPAPRMPRPSREGSVTNAACSAGGSGCGALNRHHHRGRIDTDPGLARISHQLPAVGGDVPAIAGLLPAAALTTCLRHASAAPWSKTHTDRHLHALATKVCEKCRLAFGDPSRSENAPAQKVTAVLRCSRRE